MNGGQYIVLVVLTLFQQKHDTWREQFILHESVCRISHVKLTFTLGCIYLQRLVVCITHSQQIGNSQSRDAIVHVSSMQLKLAIALQNLTDMGQTVEIVFHTFHLDHQLTVLIDSQCLIFQALCCHFHLRKPAYLSQHRVVSWESLTFQGSNLQLGVHLGEQRSHHIMKSVEHAQRHHQCHRGYCNTYYRDAANHIDGMGRLLRKEVAPGYVKREIHLFLQQFINTLHIVERIVYEEAQFRNDTQLIADTSTQLITYLLLILCNVLNQLFTFL